MTLKQDIIEIHGLTKHFDGVLAVSELDLSVPRGLVTAIIGPNGAGKTTLFHMITGFLRPDKGSIHFKGHDLVRFAPYRVARLGIARTFQDLRLIRQMTLLDNVLLATSTSECEGLLSSLRRGYLRCVESANRKKAIEWLEFVGLQDNSGSLAGELSYGQQKLLSLACCLATGAELLLLDEPVAGVSPTTTERLLEYLAQLPSLGRTVLFIEHNLDAVRSVADRVVVMDEGRKIAEGSWDDVSAASNVLEAYLA